MLIVNGVVDSVVTKILVGSTIVVYTDNVVEVYSNCPSVMMYVIVASTVRVS
jgi:hypothetical protein